MTPSTLPTVSLQGRTALVTGAATGIGRACALRLAQAGAFVWVNHLGQAGAADAVVREIAAAGGRAQAIKADVSAAAAVQRMAGAVGAVDVLVNNAGVIQEKPFLETTEADWDRMLAVDLKAVFLVCRAVIPGMLAPGPVATAMVSLEHMSAEWVEKELAIPQHRLGAPEEIADSVLFLASDLSRFYTGQVLGPNGGSAMP